MPEWEGKIVSLFTDASYHHRTGAAGWGAWAKSDLGRVSNGDAFSHPMASSGEAELCAIVNGIHMAYTKGVARKGYHFHIQTDCLEVVFLLIGRGRVKTETQKKALDKIKTWTTTLVLTYTVKHVKGHTRGDTPRTWVNNECDRLARLGKDKALRRMSGGFKGAEVLLQEPDAVRGQGQDVEVPGLQGPVLHEPSEPGVHGRPVKCASCEEMRRLARRW